MENKFEHLFEQTLAVHQIFKIFDRWRDAWPKGRPSGPTIGPTDPTGRPTLGYHWVGPTFSNGSIAVVAGLSSSARAIFPLNRGREGGVKLSYSLPSLTLPLTSFCSGFHWILTQVWFQEISLSHFFAARLITYLEEQLSGKNFILISLT